MCEYVVLTKPETKKPTKALLVAPETPGTRVRRCILIPAGQVLALLKFMTVLEKEQPEIGH